MLKVLKASKQKPITFAVGPEIFEEGHIDVQETRPAPYRAVDRLKVKASDQLGLTQLTSNLSSLLYRFSNGYG
jgi:hypothetical protein